MAKTEFTKVICGDLYRFEPRERAGNLRLRWVFREIETPFGGKKWRVEESGFAREKATREEIEAVVLWRRDYRRERRYFKQVQESAIYINDGHRADGSTVDFAGAILDGKKKGETRGHNRLTRKWVGIVHGGKVVGRVRLGMPRLLEKGTQDYKDSLIEGTEFDLKKGETKFYYPVEDFQDFRDNPREVIRYGNYAAYCRPED